MSAAFEKLRAIRVRIAALRVAGIDDHADLSALFKALEKIIPEGRHAASSASASIPPLM
jgi:hypothetical protein